MEVTSDGVRPANRSWGSLSRAADEDECGGSHAEPQHNRDLRCRDRFARGAYRLLYCLAVCGHRGGRFRPASTHEVLVLLALPELTMSN